MTAKHTPGPWQANTRAVGGGPLAYCCVTRSFPGNVIPNDVDVCTLNICEGINNPANARLIAAAPDLLEALELTKARWDYIHANFPSRKWTNGDQEAYDAVSAALAKAKGE